MSIKRTKRDVNQLTFLDVKSLAWPSRSCLPLNERSHHASDDAKSSSFYVRNDDALSLTSSTIKGNKHKTWWWNPRRKGKQEQKESRKVYFHFIRKWFRPREKLFKNSLNNIESLMFDSVLFSTFAGSKESLWIAQQIVIASRPKNSTKKVHDAAVGVRKRNTKRNSFPASHLYTLYLPFRGPLFLPRNRFRRSSSLLRFKASRENNCLE